MNTQHNEHRNSKPWPGLLMTWFICAPLTRFLLVLSVMLMGIWAMDVIGDSVRIHNSSQDHLLAAVEWITS